MNTLKTTMSKIAKIEQPKVELAKHEVELALIDDIKKLNDLTEAEAKKFVDTYKKIFSQLDITINAGEKYYQNASKYEALLAEVDKKSKELGLNALDNPNYKKAKDILTRYDINAVFERVQNLRRLK
jgi:hypothetical protein